MKRYRKKSNSLSPSKKRIKNVTTLTFGRFEGTWDSQDVIWKYSFSLDCHNFIVKKKLNDDLVVVDGFIEWQLTEARNSGFENMLNEKACEVVRGTFNQQTKELFVVGYAVKEHRQFFISVDMYKLRLSGDNALCKSKTDHFDWSGEMQLKRACTKKELRKILSKTFDEYAITDIVADFLHHFDIPTIVRYKWHNVSSYLKDENGFPKKAWTAYEQKQIPSF